MTDTFAFTVTISASEWSELQRRLRFVEAALIQTLRGQRRLKEWFSAAELADLALPGIPATKQGLLKRAHTEQWRNRRMYGAGGERFEFHFAALPRHAFEALLERIVVTTPDMGGETPQAAPVPSIPPRALQVPLPVQAVNATPPWLLPLLRIIRSGGADDMDDMAREVAARLPPGAPPPTQEEIRAALKQFGYAS